MDHFLTTTSWMKLSIGIINRCVCCKSLEICLCMIFIPLNSSDIIKHNQESGMLHFYLCNLPTKITSPPLAFQHSGKRKKEKEKVLVTTELAIFIRKFLSSHKSSQQQKHAAARKFQCFWKMQIVFCFINPYYTWLLSFRKQVAKQTRLKLVQSNHNH